MTSKWRVLHPRSLQRFVASLVLATSVCTLPWGCGPSSLPVPVEFELITSSSVGPPTPSSEKTTLAYRFFTDAEAWSQFRQATFSETLPAVSFANDAVLCVYQGTQSTGGYEIRVRDLRLQGEVLHVVLELREPRSGDMLIQVVTEPYAIYRVRLPQDATDPVTATDLQLRFVRAGENGEQPLDVRKLERP